MVFHFTNALVRAPGRSVVNGLSTQSGPRPTFEAVAAEHALYVKALEASGVTVEVLPALEDYPDSIFVEDPALVFAGGVAMLLRPGAPSRQGEVTEIAGALRQRFGRIMAIEEGFADGGDMLLTPAGMFIGLSGRTDRKGATELSGLLRQIGIAARIVNTPEGTLHLKSDCSLIADDHVLCTASLAASNIFDGYRKLVVPETERAAANALRLNDTVLVGDRFPKTIQLLQQQGYTVRAVPTQAIGRLDAGLSCMSLRWSTLSR